MAGEARRRMSYVFLTSPSSNINAHSLSPAMAFRRFRGPLHEVCGEISRAVEAAHTLDPEKTAAQIERNAPLRARRSVYRMLAYTTLGAVVLIVSFTPLFADNSAETRVPPGHAIRGRGRGTPRQPRKFGCGTGAADSRHLVGMASVQHLAWGVGQVGGTGHPASERRRRPGNRGLHRQLGRLPSRASRWWFGRATPSYRPRGRPTPMLRTAHRRQVGPPSSPERSRSPARPWQRCRMLPSHSSPCIRIGCHRHRWVQLFWRDCLPGALPGDRPSCFPPQTDGRLRRRRAGWRR